MERLVRNVQDRYWECLLQVSGDNMGHTLVRALWIIFTPTWWFWICMLFSTSFFQAASLNHRE